MRIELDMPQGLEEQLRNVVLNTVREAMNQYNEQQLSKEWMSLKEGSAYAGVSYNTFIKFRELGLRVCEIDGVKRVSKKEIDDFLEKNSH
ncbi:helix-turn-helix domain-containing protein [Sporosarcina sp. ACRSL]|uniref:helix-turn-helix domain-containing protein n=1 Tax=Sporosarcina sp. ACRSL TaxID=2918215 RepID=UPI001EF617F3|nr:helix-turn-helix domain-containing protein [Sporosarcina sp. ACRSL]MCG7346079.1 helix-turn-helix domain-containing protein [Sporosarcina sp. ACRSL]